MNLCNFIEYSFYKKGLPFYNLIQLIGKVKHRKSKLSPAIEKITQNKLSDHKRPASEMFNFID